MDLRAICLASPEFVDVNYVPGPLPLLFFVCHQKDDHTLFLRTTLFGLQCLLMHAIIFDVPLFVVRRFLVGMFIVE